MYIPALECIGSDRMRCCLLTVVCVALVVCIVHACLAHLESQYHELRSMYQGAYTDFTAGVPLTQGTLLGSAPPPMHTSMLQPQPQHIPSFGSGTSPERAGQASQRSLFASRSSVGSLDLLSNSQLDGRITATRMPMHAVRSADTYYSAYSGAARDAADGQQTPEQQLPQYSYRAEEAKLAHSLSNPSLQPYTASLYQIMNAKHPHNAALRQQYESVSAPHTDRTHVRTRQMQQQPDYDSTLSRKQRGGAARRRPRVAYENEHDAHSIEHMEKRYNLFPQINSP